MNANQRLTYAGHSHGWLEYVHKDKYGAYFYFIQKGLGPIV